MGFGITYTFTIPYKEDARMSNFSLYVYGILSSWFTVFMFLIGIFVGFIKGVRGDGD